MGSTKPPVAPVRCDSSDGQESISASMPTYAAMLRAVKIDRLSTAAPENEGIENRFHRAGSERIEL